MKRAANDDRGGDQAFAAIWLRALDLQANEVCGPANEYARGTDQKI
jgi:hypothetical protein